MRIVGANKFLIKKYIDILNAMYIYGPRNLSEIARRLNIPKRTVHERFKKLREKYLKIHLNIDLHKIGMVNTILFLVPTSNKFNIAKKILLKHDFLHKIYMCLGEYTGFYAVFNLPVENISDFEDYLEYLLSRDIIESRMTYYAYDFIYVKPSFSLLNENKHAWLIDFDEILEEEIVEKNFLPKEIDKFRIEGDNIDMYIINFLQRDATQKFSEIFIGKNFSRSLVKYHFDKHVRKIIKDYFFKFNPFSTDYINILARIQFGDKKSMNNFLSKLIRTPFLTAYSVEFGGGNIFLEMRIPLSILDFFEEILDRARKFDILGLNINILSKCYEEYRPIPAVLFDKKSRKWIFRNEKYMRI